MKKSRTINDFKQLSNNEQISELTCRLEEIKKDYMKFFQLLSCKHFESLTKQQKACWLYSPEHVELRNTAWEIYNDFTKLIPFMGQYQEI